MSDRVDNFDAAEYHRRPRSIQLQSNHVGDNGGRYAVCASPEKLLRKSDVDLAFSLTKPGWEKAAATIVYPGWEVRTAKHETGVSFMAYNPSNGVGLSIQPLYIDEATEPTMVFVKSHFPLGMLPPMTDNLRKEMDATAQNRAARSRVRDEVKSVEFLITKA